MPAGERRGTVVVIGPDGSGRTHALASIVGVHPGPIVEVRPTPFDREVPLGGLGPLLGSDTGADPRAIAGRLGRDTLVAVDDAHLLGPDALRFLAALAAAGTPIVAAAAGTDDPHLAGLLDVLLLHGTARRLEPLDEAATAAVIAAATGRAAPSQDVVRLLEDCAGMPALVAAVADDPSRDVPAALADRVARRSARLGPGAAGLLRALAVSGEVPDRVLARLAGIPETELGSATSQLTHAGFLVPGTERLVPAVARAVLAGLPGAERRRLHEVLGTTMADLGFDPVAAATHLRRGRAVGPEAAARFAAAGDRLRFRDPDAAIGWYEDAELAGAPAASVAGGRAEAHAATGMALPAEHPTDERGAARVRAARAVLAVRDGRWGRAAELLGDLGDHDLGPAAPLLAVPALLATGELDRARRALAGAEGARGETAEALRLLADAALAAATGAPDTVARFVEAAEHWDRRRPDAPTLVTPHHLGAGVASLLGDVEAAEHLLSGHREEASERLTLAWVRLRAGRYDTASRLCRTRLDHALDGRDRIVLAALDAGLARRSGDIGRMRDAWEAASAALLRQTVDLWSLEPTGELLLAASRLRQSQRSGPLLDRLAEIVGAVGSPAPWAAALAWLRLELALGEERHDDVPAIAADLAAIAAGDPRRTAMAEAAASWSDVLAGRIDLDLLLTATGSLAAAELPWEASRLAGRAALATTDPRLARRLLERARELTGGGTEDGDADGSGLSERELEVARFVLDGLTHKEIGAQLYISPKTVEHHVARIRTKLGASTRAEMLVAIRSRVQSGEA